MPQVLAVCENGHFFPTYGVELGGEPYVTVLEATFTVGEDVPVSDCPECGTHARILGGVYNVVGDTLELLQGPEHTVSELERLREILRIARESGASPQEVGSTLQREFPEWGWALAKLLVPRTPADFFALLNLIVAVVGVLLVLKQEGQDTNAKPDQIINNITVVQEAPQDPGQQPVIAPSTNPAYGKKVGRNDPCPCESGVKFKRCHGKSGQTRYYGP
jgi:SEC-C motif-containing protein